MSNWIKSGGELLVSKQDGASSQSKATITGLANGGFVVSWTDDNGAPDDTDGSSVKAQIFDASGNKIGSEFLVNTQTVNNQLQPAVTALSNGGFVISWEDISGPDGNLNVRAQIFDATGSFVGTEFLINTITEGEQYEPSITSLPNGGFVVSWFDYSGALDDPTIGNIKAQIFSAAGAKVGTEFLVNEQMAQIQGSPAVSGLPGGGFVISWQDFSGTLGDSSYSSIKAQRFDASGAKIGSEFRVNTETLSSQYMPNITTLSNGNFVVSWLDYSKTLGDTSSPSVKAQIFDASGGKIGGEFLVNTQTEGYQFSSTITSLTTGGFVVAWHGYYLASEAGDNDGSSVIAQVFDASGQKVGGELLVNTQTNGDQLEPTITALANGGFAVTWEDNGVTPGSLGVIKAQIFNPPVNTPPTLTIGAQSVQLVEAGTSVAGTSTATMMLSKADADMEMPPHSTRRDGRRRAPARSPRSEPTGRWCSPLRRGCSPTSSMIAGRRPMRWLADRRSPTVSKSKSLTSMADR